MTRTQRFFVLWLPAAALLLTGAVVALGAGRQQQVQRPGVSDAYQLSDTATAYRTGLTAADSGAVQTFAATAGNRIYCGGFPSITVTGKNPTASTTADVTVIGADYDGTTFSPKFQQEFRLTTGAFAYDTGTLYLTDSIAVDTAACDVMFVMVRTVSAGTLQLWVEAH